MAVAAVAVPVLAVTLGRRWAAGRSRWLRGLATTLEDARIGLLSRRAWPGVALLSAATLAGYLALFVVAARTAGSTAPVTQLLPPMILALLAMGLPVGVGGWGPREGVATLAFGAAGLGAAQGLASAVVYGVLALVASLPGAVVLLLRRGTRAGGAARAGRADRAGRTGRAGDGAAVPALAVEHGEVLGERRDEAVDHALSLPGRGQ